MQKTVVLLFFALVLVVIMASTDAETLASAKYTKNNDPHPGTISKGNICTSSSCIGTGKPIKNSTPSSASIVSDREALIMGVKSRMQNKIVGIMCTSAQCMNSKSPKASKKATSSITGDVETLYHAVNTLSAHVENGMESEDEQVLNNVHALLSKAYSM